LYRKSVHQPFRKFLVQFCQQPSGSFAHVLDRLVAQFAAQDFSYIGARKIVAELDVFVINATTEEYRSMSISAGTPAGYCASHERSMASLSHWLFSSQSRRAPGGWKAGWDR
jgi:hypothetical protein